METTTLSQLAIQGFGLKGHYWYTSLDSKVIRNYVDKLFPDLAKDSIADNLDGKWHRWKEGHDLLTDVFPKLFTRPGEAFHQAGHILLTDFPTRDGIPIPGLSANGLGQMLTDMGIEKGYLCLNIDNAIQGGIGIMAVSESHTDLITAMNGGTLDGWTAFDTYGEGIFELCAGIHTSNPLLIAAGIEDVAAGLARTYNTIEIAIDEMVTTIDEFFGAALGGSLIGIAISHFLWRNRSAEERIRKALFTGTRAAILGGASAISPFLSLGLAAGFCFHELCKSIIEGKAKVHEYEPGIYKVMLNSSMESPTFKETWEAYSACQHSIEQLTEKQAVEIQGHLATTMEAFSALLADMEPKLPAATLPVGAEGDITAMLNKQQDDIEQLINRSTTY